MVFILSCFWAENKEQNTCRRKNGILQIAKKRRQRHFYIGGSCRMTRLCLALRVVAASGSVVSLRYSPFGPSPQAAPLSHFATRLILRLALRANAIALFKIVPDNFVDSNLRQVRILYIADSKKAPLGRFFTLVGRAGFEPATN